MTSASTTTSFGHFSVTSDAGGLSQTVRRRRLRPSASAAAVRYAERTGTRGETRSTHTARRRAATPTSATPAAPVRLLVGHDHGAFGRACPQPTAPLRRSSTRCAHASERSRRTARAHHVAPRARARGRRECTFVDRMRHAAPARLTGPEKSHENSELPTASLRQRRRRALSAGELAAGTLRG